MNDPEKFIKKNCPRDNFLGINLDCGNCQKFFPEVFSICLDLRLEKKQKMERDQLK